MGARKRDHPARAYVVEAVLKLSFRFRRCRASAARAVEGNGNFVFYGGSNFSGDDGVTDYSTEILLTTPTTLYTGVTEGKHTNFHKVELRDRR